MKNSLTDLHNLLFEQMERINDDSLSPEEVELTLKKADGINKIAISIISNANLQFKAYQELGRKAEKGISETLGIGDGSDA